MVAETVSPHSIEALERELNWQSLEDKFDELDNQLLNGFGASAPSFAASAPSSRASTSSSSSGLCRRQKPASPAVTTARPREAARMEEHIEASPQPFLLGSFIGEEGDSCCAASLTKALLRADRNFVQSSDEDAAAGEPAKESSSSSAAVKTSEKSRGLHSQRKPWEPLARLNYGQDLLVSDPSVPSQPCPPQPPVPRAGGGCRQVRSPGPQAGALEVAAVGSRAQATPRLSSTARPQCRSPQRDWALLRGSGLSPQRSKSLPDREWSQRFGTTRPIVRSGSTPRSRPLIQSLPKALDTSPPIVWHEPTSAAAAVANGQNVECLRLASQVEDALHKTEREWRRVLGGEAGVATALQHALPPQPSRQVVYPLYRLPGSGTAIPAQQPQQPLQALTLCQPGAPPCPESSPGVVRCLPSAYPRQITAAGATVGLSTSTSNSRVVSPSKSSGACVILPSEGSSPYRRAPRQSSASSGSPLWVGANTATTQQMPEWWQLAWGMQAARWLLRAVWYAWASQTQASSGGRMQLANAVMLTAAFLHAVLSLWKRSVDMAQRTRAGVPPGGFSPTWQGADGSSGRHGTALARALAARAADAARVVAFEHWRWAAGDPRRRAEVDHWRLALEAQASSTCQRYASAASVGFAAAERCRRRSLRVLAWFGWRLATAVGAAFGKAATSAVRAQSGEPQLGIHVVLAAWFWCVQLERTIRAYSLVEERASVEKASAERQQEELLRLVLYFEARMMSQWLRRLMQNTFLRWTNQARRAGQIKRLALLRRNPAEIEAHFGAWARAAARCHSASQQRAAAALQAWRTWEWRTYILELAFLWWTRHVCSLQRSEELRRHDLELDIVLRGKRTRIMSLTQRLIIRCEEHGLAQNLDVVWIQWRAAVQCRRLAAAQLQMRRAQNQRQGHQLSTGWLAWRLCTSYAHHTAFLTHIVLLAWQRYMTAREELASDGWRSIKSSGSLRLGLSPHRHTLASRQAVRLLTGTVASHLATWAHHTREVRARRLVRGMELHRHESFLAQCCFRRLLLKCLQDWHLLLALRAAKTRTLDVRAGSAMVEEGRLRLWLHWISWRLAVAAQPVRRCFSRFFDQCLSAHLENALRTCMRTWAVHTQAKRRKSLEFAALVPHYVEKLTNDFLCLVLASWGRTTFLQRSLRLRLDVASVAEDSFRRSKATRCLWAWALQARSRGREAATHRRSILYACLRAWSWAAERCSRVSLIHRSLSGAAMRTTLLLSLQLLWVSWRRVVVAEAGMQVAGRAIAQERHWVSKLAHQRVQFSESLEVAHAFRRWACHTCTLHMRHWALFLRAATWTRRQEDLSAQLLSECFSGWSRLTPGLLIPAADGHLGDTANPRGTQQMGAWVVLAAWQRVANLQAVWATANEQSRHLQVQFAVQRTLLLTMCLLSHVLGVWARRAGRKAALRKRLHPTAQWTGGWSLLAILRCWRGLSRQPVQLAGATHLLSHAAAAASSQLFLRVLWSSWCRVLTEEAATVEAGKQTRNLQRAALERVTERVACSVLLTQGRFFAAWSSAACQKRVQRLLDASRRAGCDLIHRSHQTRLLISCLWAWTDAAQRRRLALTTREALVKQREGLMCTILLMGTFSHWRTSVLAAALAQAADIHGDKSQSQWHSRCEEPTHSQRVSGRGDFAESPISQMDERLEERLASRSIRFLADELPDQPTPEEGILMESLAEERSGPIGCTATELVERYFGQLSDSGSEAPTEKPDSVSRQADQGLGDQRGHGERLCLENGPSHVAQNLTEQLAWQAEEVGAGSDVIERLEEQPVRSSSCLAEEELLAQLPDEADTSEPGLRRQLDLGEGGTQAPKDGAVNCGAPSSGLQDRRPGYLGVYVDKMKELGESGTRSSSSSRATRRMKDTPEGSRAGAAAARQTSKPTWKATRHPSEGVSRRVTDEPGSTPAISISLSQPQRSDHRSSHSHGRLPTRHANRCPDLQAIPEKGRGCSNSGLAPTLADRLAGASFVDSSMPETSAVSARGGSGKATSLSEATALILRGGGNTARGPSREPDCSVVDTQPKAPAPSSSHMPQRSCTSRSSQRPSPRNDRHPSGPASRTSSPALDPHRSGTPHGRLQTSAGNPQIQSPHSPRPGDGRRHHSTCGGVSPEPSHCPATLPGRCPWHGSGAAAAAGVGLYYECSQCNRLAQNASPATTPRIAFTGASPASPAGTTNLAPASPHGRCEGESGWRHGPQRPLQHDLLEHAAVRRWVAQAESEALARPSQAQGPHGRLLAQAQSRRRQRVEVEQRHELLDQVSSEMAGADAGDEAPTPPRRILCKQATPAEETPRHIRVKLVQATTIEEEL